MGLLAELRHAKRASGAPWVRFFLVIYQCVQSYRDCQGGGGEAGQPLGTRVFWQFSLAGNCVAAFHWKTAYFLVGNHISDE